MQNFLILLEISIQIYQISNKFSNKNRIPIELNWLESNSHRFKSMGIDFSSIKSIGTRLSSIQFHSHLLTLPLPPHIGQITSTLSSCYVHTYKYDIERHAGHPLIPNVFSGFNSLTTSVACDALFAARWLWEEDLPWVLKLYSLAIENPKALHPKQHLWQGKHAIACFFVLTSFREPWKLVSQSGQTAKSSSSFQTLTNRLHL